VGAVTVGHLDGADTLDGHRAVGCAIEVECGIGKNIRNTLIREQWSHQSTKKADPWDDRWLPIHVFWVVSLENIGSNKKLTKYLPLPSEQSSGFYRWWIHGCMWLADLFGSTPGWL
jgi:hypothetical protein